MPTIRLLAKKLLAEAGYPHGFKTNVVATADADLALLKIVLAYWADIGIETEVRVMGVPDWIKYVEIEKKHDQLVYRPYGPFGHTYAPLRAITRFQTGYSANHMMVADPVFDAFYPKAIAAKNETELRQVLRDANERVTRQHYAVSLLLPLQYSFCQPWLKGFHAQVPFHLDGLRRAEHAGLLCLKVLCRPEAEAEHFASRIKTVQMNPCVFTDVN